MADSTTHTTGSLAAMLNGSLIGCDDLAISGVNSLADAGPNDITFITSEQYAKRWSDSRAAAAIVTRDVQVPHHDENQRALIVVTNAELAIAKVLEAFAPPAAQPDEGIHPTASINEQTTIGSGVRIGPHVSIDRGAVVGQGVVLHAGVRIYADARIGDRTVIHANTVIGERCVIGNDVILHQSVSIGADGFGYRMSEDGTRLVKMPHIGNVIVEDHVEIGANSCVDRAKFSSTVIGWGTKIDNLVQIAHNCRIGRSCVIAGMAGLAGSVTVGDGVQVGAQVGIADGLTIGRGARLGAQSGITRDVPPGMTVFGTPANDIKQTLRQEASLRKLPVLVQKLSRQLRTSSPNKLDQSLDE
jgi:UDP-3-O-[3-hydroxymyristoyl] glucosamine N-acyltransferase